MASAQPATSSVVVMPTGIEVRWVRRRLLKWWAHHGREFWWRQVRDPYTVAIVEILLKQTRASTVDLALATFVGRYQTPEDLSRIPEAQLSAELRPFGLHRQRAAHLKQFASAVIEDPQALQGTTSDLRKLPGLGAYAAAAVSVFAHGRRETVVDVNVVRIFSRVWNLSVPRGELRKSQQIAAVAEMYRATSRPREANWALLDLGALVCTAVSPSCLMCPLRTRCAYARDFRMLS